MTLDQLDVLRGYAIAILLVSFVAIGVASKLSSRAARVAVIAAQIIGGCAGLTLFFILNFVSGWDEYLSAKAANLPAAEYQGRRGGATRVIKSLGELEASGLGIVFGLVGLTLVVAAIMSICAGRRAT